MNIIVCLDDNYGMAFNGRRQSMDRCVRQEILSLSQGFRLWMSEYTFSQFESHYDNIIADDGFLSKAGDDDFCFIETDSVQCESVDKIYAFFWNRRYPSDLKFDIEANGFRVVSIRDFAGNSHEKITLKLYEKERQI